MRALPLHEESSALIPASPHALFEHLDAHSRLSSHMTKSSRMLGGGRMQIETDADRGRSVGSHIWLSGRVFGVRLSLEEIVMERVPPSLKVWETVGLPKLVVIGQYRMGFEIAARGEASELRVFIDYALPDDAWTRWIGRLLGAYYARWCVEQMVTDAARHFQATEAVPAAVDRPAESIRGNP